MDKLNLMPLFMIRWAGLPMQSLVDPHSPRYALALERLRLQKWLTTYKPILVDALFVVVESTPPEEGQLDVLKLKRDIFNDRLPKSPTLLDRVSRHTSHRIRRLLNIWHHVVSRLQEVQMLGEVADPVQEKEQFLRFLELARTHTEFQRALALTNPSMYLSLQKYLLHTPTEIRTRERKFLVSLVKYLTRSMYKTSPISHLGVVGFGRWQDEVEKPATKQLAIWSKSRLNLSIRMRAIAAHVDRYHLQPNLWTDGDTLFYFKRQDGYKPDVTFDIQESIMRLSHSDWTDFLVNLNFPREGFRFDEIEMMARARFPEYDPSAIREWIQQTINAKLLIKTQNYMPQTVISNILEELETHAARLSALESSERIAALAQIREQLHQLEIGDNSMPVYEDCLVKNPFPFSRPLWQSVLQDLQLLHRLLPLFDVTLRKRLIYADHFYKKWGKMRGNLPELVEDYYSFFQNNQQDLFSLDADAGLTDEVLHLNVVRAEFVELIRNENDGNTIELDVNRLRRLADQLPTRLSNQPTSTMFFVQPTRSYRLVLNKIYSGFGRCFSRFANWDDSLATVLAQELKALQGEGPAFLDLDDTYGSNTNLHPRLTTLRLSDVGLSNLNFVYDEMSKQIQIQTLEGDQLLPLHLGQMSIWNLPVSRRFLALLTQFETIDLNLSEHIFKSLLKENPDQMVYPVPAIGLGDLTLLRKQWWVQNQWLVQQLAPLSDWETTCFLLGFFQAHGMPLQFFMSPSKYTKLQNFNRVNDFYKPQFIDLRSDLCVRLFKKSVMEFGSYLLIEEMAPQFDEILPIADTIRQVEFGIEINQKA